MIQAAVETHDLTRRFGSLTAVRQLTLRIEKTFPLAEAAAAHRALEGRSTTGKVLLIP